MSIDLAKQMEMTVAMSQVYIVMKTLGNALGRFWDDIDPETIANARGRALALLESLDKLADLSRSDGVITNLAAAREAFDALKNPRKPPASLRVIGGRGTEAAGGTD